MLLIIYTRLDTTTERIPSNACHAVWDGDGGKAATVPERTFTNACHAISNTIIGNRFRNGNIARVLI